MIDWENFGTAWKKRTVKNFVWKIWAITLCYVVKGISSSRGRRPQHFYFHVECHTHNANEKPTMESKREEKEVLTRKSKSQ